MTPTSTDADVHAAAGASISAATPSRSSSKHEIDRNPTMPSVPSVSNLSWP